MARPGLMKVREPRPEPAYCDRDEARTRAGSWPA